MKKILFGSIIRDGESYLPRYYDQLKSLTKDYEIGLAICEGDSLDDTGEMIYRLLPSELALYSYTYSHNGPKFGSVDVSERWFNIAKTWNYMLDNIVNEFEEYDYFCYMEADLIWDKATIDKLVEGMEEFDCVAPMSMLGENWFYDTWGHRSNGMNFAATYPYHPYFNDYLRYMPLDSAGSCILMKSEVAKNCRLSLKDAMIGHDIIKKGYSFVLDKIVIVNHP